MRVSGLRIALSRSSNAKVVLVAPETVWQSSKGFGQSDCATEAGADFHSSELFGRVKETLFEPTWNAAGELR